MKNLKFENVEKILNWLQDSSVLFSVTDIMRKVACDRHGASNCDQCQFRNNHSCPGSEAVRKPHPVGRDLHVMILAAVPNRTI